LGVNPFNLERGEGQRAVNELAYRAACEGKWLTSATLSMPGMYEPSAYEARPLNCAAGNDHLDVARLLIRLGHQVDAPDPATGMTPLQLAVMENRPGMTQMLIDKGAKVSTHGQHKPTLIALAAEKLDLDGFLRVIRFVKTHNGDLSDYDARTPLLTFVTKTKLIDAKVLVAKSPETQAIYQKMQSVGSLAPLVAALRQEGLPLHTSGTAPQNGLTHLAAERLDIELFEWLDKNAYPVNSLNANGDDAFLIVASQYIGQGPASREFLTMDKLLELGAVAYRRNSDGFTVAHLAIRHPEIRQMFKTRGVELDYSHALGSVTGEPNAHKPPQKRNELAVLFKDMSNSEFLSAMNGGFARHAARAGLMDDLKRAITLGFDIDSKETEGRCSLIYLAAEGRYDDTPNSVASNETAVWLVQRKAAMAPGIFCDGKGFPDLNVQEKVIKLQGGNVSLR
jgi:ankyrin repeat protein